MEDDLKEAQKLHESILDMCSNVPITGTIEQLVTGAARLNRRLLKAEQWDLGEQVCQDLKLLSDHFPENREIKNELYIYMTVLMETYITNDLGQRVEKTYEDLKTFSATTHQDFYAGGTLSHIMDLMIGYYIAKNEIQKVETFYKNREELTQEFLTTGNLLWGLDRTASNVATFYRRLNKWSQIEQLYQNLKTLTLHFTQLDTDAGAWRVAKIATSLIIYYMAQNQRQRVEQLYQDLRIFSLHMTRNKFLGFVVNSIEHYKSDAKNWGVYKEETLINWDRVNKEVENIYNEYRTRPEILLTDKEFYSDDTHKKTIKDKVYFLSAESPEQTAMITGYLIRQEKIRYTLMHYSRVQKATQNSVDLAGKIEAIKQDYIATHNGKEPSVNKIAHILTEQEIVSPGGKTTWHAKTVQRILDAPENSSRRK